VPADVGNKGSVKSAIGHRWAIADFGARFFLVSHGIPLELPSGAYIWLLVRSMSSMSPSLSPRMLSL